jgi:type VI secretion system protein ImpA
MPSPPLLDFERLLAPISREQPAGPLLRYTDDEDYIKLKEAYRRKDQPSMTVAEEDPEAVPWQTIIEHAGRLLATKSKDLEPATWLVEALAAHYGLGGLRDGLRLLGALLQGYWADLHPHDEDEATTVEARANSLAGLNDALPYWIQTFDRRPAPDLSVAEGKRLWEDLSQCLEALQRLNQGIEALCGAQRPCLIDIEEALQDYGRWLQAARSHHCDSESGLGESSTAVALAQPPLLAPVASLPHPGLCVVSPTLHSREDALVLLSRLADYFQVTEPLGPLAPLLQCARRWASMSFTQWLQEVVRDERMFVEDSLLRFLCAKTQNTNETA